MVDLFETPEVLPKEVQAILEKYSQSDFNYEQCNYLVDELEQVGYTCEFGLDAIPYDLKKIIKEPKFYQAVLKPIKDIMNHVYPQGGITLEERMGNNAECPECGHNEWLLLADKQVAVAQGGKPYCECLGCGMMTHL